MTITCLANYSFRSSSMYPMRSNRKTAHSDNSSRHCRARDLALTCLDFKYRCKSRELSGTFKSFAPRPLLSYGGSIQWSYSSSRCHCVVSRHFRTSRFSKMHENWHTGQPRAPRRFSLLSTRPTTNTAPPHLYAPPRQPRCAPVSAYCRVDAMVGWKLRGAKCNTDQFWRT